MRISDGKTAKSSGFLICIETSRISSEHVMLRPSSRSRIAAGRGTTSIRTMATTPIGTAILLTLFMRPPHAGTADAGSPPPHRQPLELPVPPVRRPSVRLLPRRSGSFLSVDPLKPRLLIILGSRGDAAAAGLGQALDLRRLEAGPVEAALHPARTQVHHERQHPGDRGEQLAGHLLAELARRVQ